MTRIYTEDKHRPAIIRLVSDRVDGATFIPAIGLWKGVTEPSLIIELAHTTAYNVRAIAEDIRELNKQESVLIAWQDGTSEFVTAESSVKITA